MSDPLQLLDELYQKLENFSLEEFGSDIVKPVYQKASHLLNEERETVRKLEKELSEVSEKEASLLRTMNEATTFLDTHQQKVKEYQTLLEEENQENRKLLAQIEAIEEEIRIETDNEAGTDDLSGESLKLAIFQQMGITMIADNECRVKKCVLTSDNGQEVRTVPLDKYSIKQTSKIIWDFISKDV